MTMNDISRVVWAHNFIERVNSGNFETTERLLNNAEETISKFINSLPYGSGFNARPEIISATVTEIGLKVPYQHMDDVGGYCGWAYYTLVITPTFNGLLYSIPHVDLSCIDRYAVDYVSGIGAEDVFIECYQDAIGL